MNERYLNRKDLAPEDFTALSLVRADGAERLWLRAGMEQGRERIRLVLLAHNLGLEAHAYRERAKQ